MRRASVSTTAALVTVGVAASLTLTGCEPTRPSDAQLDANSDQARQTVIDLADEAGAALTSSTQAGLTQSTATARARSWDCSDSPAANGEAIQWASDRDWSLESGESTADLLDPIVEHFVADGWQVTKDDPEGTRFVQLDRDGYMLQLSGEQAARSGQATQLGLTAYSPCLLAVPAGD